MSGDSFHLWSLRLEYRYASPLNLEDLEPLLNFNSMYMPMFNEKLLIPHLCIQNVIRNCSEVFDAELPDGNYKEKCENSSSLVISTGGKTRTYANRFCAYCNEGYHDRLRLEKNHNLNIKRSELQIIMAVSSSNRYSLTVANALGHNIPWRATKCYISEPPDQQTYMENTPTVQSNRTVCVAQCGGRDFILSPEGMCKARNMLVVAIAAKSLPLMCPSALPGLANFIACGLKSFSSVLKFADVRPSPVSVQYDTRLNRSLNVLTLNIDLPTEVNDPFLELVDTLNHLVILAKCLKAYGVPRNICPRRKHDRNSAEVTEKKMSSRSLKMVMSSIFFRSLFSNRTNQFRGSLVDENYTTTVCSDYITLYSKREYGPNYLICMESGVFQRDAEIIAAFSNSQCFDFLHNTTSKAMGCGSLVDSHETLPWLVCLSLTNLFINIVRF